MEARNLQKLASKHSPGKVSASHQIICFNHSVQLPSVLSSGKDIKNNKKSDSSQICVIPVLGTRKLEHNGVQILPNDTDSRATVNSSAGFQEGKLPKLQ